MTNNLKELRIRNNYTQQELAELVGCTAKHIGFIENNERTPSLLLAKKIANVFNKHIDDIFLPI